MLTAYAKLTTTLLTQTHKNYVILKFVKVQLCQPLTAPNYKKLLESFDFVACSVCEQRQRRGRRKITIVFKVKFSVVDVECGNVYEI